MSIRLSYLWILVFLVIIGSCEHSLDVSNRIVGFEIEAHIEGLRIGESPAAILNSFGPDPDTLITALGLDLYLQYDDSMTVQLSKLDFDDPGYILGGVFVSAGYSGATPEGIRLGMTSSEVLDLIRVPDQSFGAENFITLSYQSSEQIFDLNFIDDLLVSVHMRRRQ